MKTASVCGFLRMDLGFCKAESRRLECSLAVYCDGGMGAWLMAGR